MPVSAALSRHARPCRYEILSDDEVRAKYDRGEDVTGNRGNQQQQGHHGFPHHFNHGGGHGRPGNHFNFHFRH